VDIKIKRVYEQAAPGDGHRVLVDGIWPRGLTRAALAIDEWRRELAPSASLRRWYGHDPARFEEFRRRYADELRAHADALDALRRRAQDGRLTLVFAARDTDHSNARVLADVLERGLPDAAESA
jgi:uncharacterized protein YeaO (DUF488 family)